MSRGESEITRLVLERADLARDEEGREVKRAGEGLSARDEVAKWRRRQMRQEIN
jgi:hypothetical protein